MIFNKLHIRYSCGYSWALEIFSNVLLVLTKSVHLCLTSDAESLHQSFSLKSAASQQRNPLWPWLKGIVLYIDSQGIENISRNRF
jgi:hypothetical protein